MKLHRVQLLQTHQHRRNLTQRSDRTAAYFKKTEKTFLLNKLGHVLNGNIQLSHNITSHKSVSCTWQSD